MNDNNYQIIIKNNNYYFLLFLLLFFSYLRLQVLVNKWFGVQFGINQHK